MKKIILLVFPVVASLLLNACSSAITSRDSVYDMSSDEAAQLILGTIQSNWPGQSVYRLGDEKVGYYFSHNYNDKQGTISIEARPAGDSAYRFIVKNRGQEEALSNSRRLIILSLLDARAAGLSK